MREAIILAGGYGTRLAHIVPDVCKPMAPICGQPFLRLLLNQLSDAGFDRVVIADGYRREQIESYFGSSYRGLELIYSSEDSPLLTGGAVKKALLSCSSEYVFVLNGDTYCDIDFKGMESLAFGSRLQPAAVIAVKKMAHYSRYGSIEVAEDGAIKRFLEKQCRESGLINAGTYLLHRKALECMPDVFSLECDYFKRSVGIDGFRAFVVDGQFVDIGVPEDYERAQTTLKHLIRRWKIAFFDRDGTINVDTGHLFEPEKLSLIDSTIPILRAFTDNVDYKVIVVTNQAGIAKGYYDVSRMRILHDALNEKLAEKGCKIDAYYYCPHHPEHTGECNCRKPKPGMIIDAIRDFGAVSSECVMFGDRESDMEAARSAGVKFAMINNSESIRSIAHTVFGRSEF